jgi:hypothetical protein
LVIDTENGGDLFEIVRMADKIIVGGRSLKPLGDMNH